MGKHFFDFEDGDFAFSISDNMAMDMDTGDIHMISSWPNDDDEDEFLSRRQQKSFSDGRRKSLPFSIVRRNESTRNC